MIFMTFIKPECVIFFLKKVQPYYVLLILMLNSEPYSLHTPEQTRPVIRALLWSIGFKS